MARKAGKQVPPEDWISQIGRFLDEHALIPHGCLVLAAVSGGADSLALLLLLAHFRTERVFDLAVAHLDHGLRGDASAGDLAFVRDWSDRCGVPFYSQRIDLAGLAAQHQIGLELAGREARLTFLGELAETLEQPGRPVRIALAHHCGDQAETLLLHLGRGSGLDGMTGMLPQSGRIIRPLLGSTRAQIIRYLTDRQITWRHDASNDSDFTLRNRLRHHVLPAWQLALGHDPAPALCRAADNLREDQIYLNDQAELAWPGCLGPLPHTLDRARLGAQPPALQNRLLRRFWSEATGSSRDLGQAHIRLIRRWLAAASADGSLNLPGRRRLLLAGTYLSLISDRADQARSMSRPDAQPVPLILPGLTRVVSLQIQIVAVLIENDSQIVYNDAMERFRLDRMAGCVVRTRQPGDYVQPAGRCGKTLKKFLIEQHVPRADRDRLPLIARDSAIVWLPGYAVGAAYRAETDSPYPWIGLRIEPLQQAVSVTEGLSGAGLIL